jgi:hypothetical protein
MNSFVGVMLRLGCAGVVAKATFVFALACVGSLVILELLLGAKCAAAWFTI